MMSLISVASGLALALYGSKWGADPAARRWLILLGAIIAANGIIIYLLTAREAHAGCDLGSLECEITNAPVVHTGDLVTITAESCTSWPPEFYSSIWLDVGRLNESAFFVLTFDGPNPRQTYAPYMAQFDGDLPHGFWAGPTAILEPTRLGCALGVSVAGTSRHRMSDAAKATLRELIVALTTMDGTVLPFLGVICNEMPPRARAICGPVLVTSGVLIGFAAANLSNALDHDPPDEDYRIVALPVLPTIGPVPLFARPLIDNERRIAALAEALYVSVNRVNTAVDMGDAQAEDLQQGAIDRYLHRLGQRFADEIELRRQLVHRFARRHFDAAALADPALLEALAAASAAL